MHAVQMLSLHLHALCIDAFLAFTSTVQKCYPVPRPSTAKPVHVYVCQWQDRQRILFKGPGIQTLDGDPLKDIWRLGGAPSSLFCRHEKDRTMIGRSIREQDNSVSEPLYPCPEQLPVCWELKIKRPLNIVRPSFVTGCN